MPQCRLKFSFSPSVPIIYLTCLRLSKVVIRSTQVFSASYCLLIFQSCLISFEALTQGTKAVSRQYRGNSDKRGHPDTNLFQS